MPWHALHDAPLLAGAPQHSSRTPLNSNSYGHANRKFSALATCEVSGGPEYDVRLSGEGADISYRLDRRGLNFGRVVYNRGGDKDFSIINTGRVPFNFRVRTDLLANPELVTVSPKLGRIFEKDRQRITVG